MARPGPRSVGSAQDARADLKKFLKLDSDNDAGRRLMREVKAECGKAYVLEEQELDVMEEGSDYDEDSDNEELAGTVWSTTQFLRCVSRVRNARVGEPACTSAPLETDVPPPTHLQRMSRS